MPDLDLRAYRQRFPICAHTTYLASCSVGALAQDVRDAVQTFLHGWNSQGPAWEEQWYGAVLEAERLFAQLYRVDERQVVLLPNVTSALMAVASAFHPQVRTDFRGRTRVLLPADEFPTLGHLWGKQPGVEIVGLPADEDDLAPHLDERTLLVCLSHVSYRTGRRCQLQPLIVQAHAAGALVLLDDSQSSGTYPVDAATLGVDLLVASGHKYLLGLPGGGAFLLVRAGLLERLHPTMSGWAAHQDFVRSVHEQGGHLRIEPGEAGWNPLAFEEAEDAWRFAGGTANVVGAAAARAGLQLLLEVGVEAILQHLDQLTARFVAGCLDQGIALLTPVDPRQRGPMVVVRTPEPARLTAALAERRILVAPRGADGVRVAFHLYNHLGDVEAILNALAAHQWLLKIDPSTAAAPGTSRGRLLSGEF